ncbi:MAG: TIGR04388 family protein [Spirochaetia bacterium]|nr:TIGR04388 family protein [Spirochaetia bacterium]
MQRVIQKIFIYSIILSVAGIFAQPAQVPSFQPPAFSSQDLNPAFNQAQGATTMGAWQSIVEGSLAGLRATWETQAQAQIDLAVGQVTQTDAIVSNQDYVNYVRAALLSQKESARTTWENQVEATIAPQRQTFISFLSAKEEEELNQSTRSALQQATQSIQTHENTAFTTAQNTVDQAKAKYEQNYNRQLNDGHSQFNLAQNEVNTSYQAFLASLNQTDLNFQQNIGNLEATEQTVRNTIGNQVTQMQTYLGQSQQFYDTNCDAQNNCTSAMNQAGQDLLSVISTMETALQSGAPLSQVTQTMVNYLGTQRTNANTTQQTWQNATDIPTNYPSVHFSSGDFFSHNNPLLDALTAWIDGNQSPLTQYYAPNPGQSLTVSNLTMQGVSPSGRGLFLGTDSTDRFYSAGDPHPFQFHYNNGCFFYICLDGWLGEGEIVVNFQANMHDANAENNATIWGGYANDLTGAENTWNGLLNSVQNWEAQVTQYKAQYTAWQGQAQTEFLNQQQAYLNASSQITQERNTWAYQMDEAHREAQADWRGISLDLERTQALTQGGDPKAQQQAAAEILGRLPVSQTLSTPNTSSLHSIVSNSGLSPFAESAYADADHGTPDSKLLDGFSKEFGSTLNGLQNFAFATKQNSDANSIRDRLISSMIDSAKQQDGSLAYNVAYGDEYSKVANEHPDWVPPETATKGAADVPDRIDEEVKRRLAGRTFSDSLQASRDSSGAITITRQAANGSASLNAGGDATNASDYHANLSTQTIHIAAAENMKLAKTGSLFQEWDQNKLIESTEEYEKRVSEAAGKQFNDAFTNASKVANENLNKAKKDAQKQAETAQKIQSLVQALLPGGGGLKGWIKDQTKSILETAFEQATGLPGGLFTNLQSGMSMGKAVSKAVTDRMQSNLIAEIDKATGLAGAGGLFMEKFNKAQENKKKHDAMKGVGALNPMNMQYTQLGKTMMNSSNPFVGASVAMMTGNPLALVPTLMSVAPKSVRSSVAKGMNQMANFMEKSGGAMAAAIAGPTMLSAVTGGPFSAMPALTGAAIHNNSKQIADSFRGLGNVVAQGGGSGNQVRENFRAGKDREISLSDALDKGDAIVKQNQQHFTKMNLGSFMSDLMLPITTLTSALQKPVTVKSPARVQFETSFSDKFSEMSGWPREFTRSMVVDGANMEDAVMAQLYGNLDAQFPSAGGMLKDRLAKVAQSKARHRAAKVKPEDLIPGYGALTYVWRNAEQHKDGALALQVVETTAAAIVNIVPVAGQAASMAMVAYMGAKQAYLGSLHGGTKGALAGATGAIIQGATMMAGMPPAPINLGLSYDRENGWGGNIGMNMPIGSGGFSGGMSLNLREGQGVVGGGLNLGYSPGKSGGWGGDLGLSFDRTGQFSGASISANRSGKDMGFAGGTGTASGGIRLDRDGKYAGIDLSYKNAQEVPIKPGDQNNPFSRFGRPFDGGQSTYLLGAGLSLNSDNSFSVNTTIGAGFTDFNKAGLNSVTGTQNSQINFNKNGGYTGVSSSIGFQTAVQTPEQRAAASRALKQALDSDDLSPEQRTQLQTEYNQLNPDEAKANYLMAHQDELRKAYKEKTGEDLTEEELGKILRNDPDAKMSRADALKETGKQVKDSSGTEQGGSREHWWEKAAGAVGDAVGTFVLGSYSDDDGYVDESGQWQQNTCYEYSVEVVTKNGTKQIGQIVPGDEVLSANPITGELSFRKVTEVFVHDVAQIFYVKYTDGTQVGTTNNHPFWIRNRGWVEATRLQHGQRSVTAMSILNGQNKPQVRKISMADNGPYWDDALEGTLEVSGIEPVRKYTKVYNIEVEGNHTYFVTRKGILVHNYLVKPGESLQILAARNGTTVEKLLELNPHLGKGRGLYKGELLILPGEENKVSKEFQEAYAELGKTYKELEETRSRLKESCPEEPCMLQPILDLANLNTLEAREAELLKKAVTLSNSTITLDQLRAAIDGKSDVWFSLENGKLVPHEVKQPPSDYEKTATDILRKVNEWSPLGLVSKAIDWLKGSSASSLATQDPKKLKLSLEGSEMLKGSEAVMSGEQGVYIDVAGNPTAGVGVLIPGVTKKYPPTKEGAALFKADYPELAKYYMERTETPEKALELYAERKVVYVDAVKKNVTVPLNQKQFDALVSLTYNIGQNSGITDFVMESRLNSGGGDERLYKAFMTRVIDSNKVVQIGLIKRRIEEYHVFNGADYNFNAANTKEMEQWCNFYKVKHAYCVAR